ncbi:MAG: hypothetical protein JSU96_01600 [Acidobacteriota bacterium]|nr:MAG: hypothetical protein JSU96_01600 [Acidobacteriota bacterium]
MTFKLLRLDPNVKGFWAPALFGIVGGLFLRTVAMRLPRDLSTLNDEQSGWLLFTVGTAWVSCLLIVLFNNLVFVSRTSPFFMALPIRAVKLWWIRMGTILLAIVIPVAIATVLVSMRVADGGSGVQFESLYLLVGARGLVTLILAAFLFQSPWPELVKVRFRFEYMLFVVFASFVLLVLVLVAPTSLLLTLGLAGVATILAIRLHRSIPAAFLLLPMEPDESPGAEDVSLRPETGETAVRTTRKGSQLHRMLFRALSSYWQMWVFAPITGLYAFLLWDAFLEGRSPFPSLLFLTVWPFILFHQGLIRLNRVDGLPIKRRLLFPYICLPALIPIFAGFIVGGLTKLPFSEDRLEWCCGEHGVQAPQEFWRVGWDGQIPSLTAAWGETVQPEALNVVPGLPVAVYFPYRAGPSNSKRFFAWQAARVQTDVLGTPTLSPDRIAALSEESPEIAGLVTTEGDECFCRFEGEVTASVLRNRTWLLGGILCTWITAVIFWIWLLQFRVSRFESASRLLFFLLLGLWGGFLLLNLLGPILGMHDAPAQGLFLMAILRGLAEWIPVGSTFLWGGLIASFGVLYLVGQQLFERVEAPLGKIKSVWRDYGQC